MVFLREMLVPQILVILRRQGRSWSWCLKAPRTALMRLRISVWELDIDWGFSLVLGLP